MFISELFLDEISDEALQRYLQGAGKVVDRRMDRMARVRDRLNKGYEIYHADRPANGKAIVDRFEADTPALARQYYEKFIHNYESDVDFDLQLRRATGIIEGEGGLNQTAGIGINGKQFNFSIQDLIAKAQNYPIKKLNPQLFVKQLADRHEDPTQTAARAQTADLQYPIIVVQDGNTLMIADGTHRAQKAIMNKLPAINARIIPSADMIEFSKQRVNETVNPMRQQAGRMIDKYFGQIYSYGDSGLDYLDNHAPTWYGLSDQYRGDIDVIIATAPVNLLVKAAQELKNVASNLAYELDEDAGQQYLWHGSRDRIPVLTPQPAVDTGGNPKSNKKAIYATADENVAIAMGLTTQGSDTGMFPNDPQMVLFKGAIRHGQMVYLHKLPTKDANGRALFEPGGNDREFTSVPGITELKPIEIKAVPVDRHLNLIRTATPADLQLQQKYQKQSVSEAFDQPYPIKWEKGEFGDYDALATLADGTYLSIMFNREEDGEYQIEFHRNYSQEVTGEGDAQRVFATVLGAIQQFIKTQQPERVRFSATKDDEDNSQSRTKLYDRLVQRYASSWGYSVDISDYAGSTVYELTNNLNEITAVPTVAKSKRQHLDVMPNDGRPIPRGEEAEYLGKFVSKMPGGYELWGWSSRWDRTYFVFDPETRISQLATTGKQYPENPNSFVVVGLYSGPKNQVRAADLYAFLIRHIGLTLVSDNKQSEGGYRVWKELERRYGKTINVHGFDTKTDQGVNVTTRDEPETHVDRDTVKRAGPQGKKELATISRDLRFVASAR
jgi:hypothetical protein